MGEYLFVGGPCDGQRRGIEGDRAYIDVEIPEQPGLWMPIEGSLYNVATEYATASYVACNLCGCRLFVYEPLMMESGWYQKVTSMLIGGYVGEHHPATEKHGESVPLPEELREPEKPLPRMTPDKMDSVASVMRQSILRQNERRDYLASDAKEDKRTEVRSTTTEKDGVCTCETQTLMLSGCQCGGA